MSELRAEIIGAGVERYAASPLINLRLRLFEDSGRRIDTIALRIQVQIDPRKRQYTAEQERKLVEIFGEPSRWGETLRAVHWTHASIMVPPFTDSTEVDIPIPATYDFDVASSKYFDALDDGEVPLLLLFSGMLFARGDTGFSAEMVPWHLECMYAMRAGIWREAMDHFFPNQAWIRIGKDTFDELYRFKSQHALLSWEAALEKLLVGAKERV
ncbi:MAG: DUF6084 family protein [Candidatus Eremiobacteraeota bacterium]|nr:DUF6084 family protein [Candidatus Eremiobacteraeota bacterium]